MAPAGETHRRLGRNGPSNGLSISGVLSNFDDVATVAGFPKPFEFIDLKAEKASA